MVEKPQPDVAPSRLAVIGRYVLMPEVFAILDAQKPGAGGEIQLTDAMARLIGRQPFHGYRFEGRRFDCGDKLGYLEAIVALAEPSATDLQPRLFARCSRATSEPAMLRPRDLRMKIAMIGTGYVGLVSGACFAEFGLDVVCVDKDAAKIEHARGGPDPDLRAGPRRAGRAHTGGRPADLHHRASPRRSTGPRRCSSPSARRRGAATAMPTSPTSSPPPRRSRPRLKHPTLVVTKSTVPVGTGRKLQKIFATQRPDLAIDVASNPEFLREGSAIEDFLRPDRVVVRGRERARPATCWRAATGRST